MQTSTLVSVCVCVCLCVEWQIECVWGWGAGIISNKGNQKAMFILIYKLRRRLRHNAESKQEKIGRERQGVDSSSTFHLTTKTKRKIYIFAGVLCCLGKKVQNTNTNTENTNTKQLPSPYTHTHIDTLLVHARMHRACIDGRVDTARDTA